MPLTALREADVSKYKDPAEQSRMAGTLIKKPELRPKAAKAFYSLHDDQLRNLPEAAKTQLKST